MNSRSLINLTASLAGSLVVFWFFLSFILSYNKGLVNQSAISVVFLLELLNVGFIKKHFNDKNNIVTKVIFLGFVAAYLLWLALADRENNIPVYIFMISFVIRYFFYEHSPIGKNMLLSSLLFFGILFLASVGALLVSTFFSVSVPIVQITLVWGFFYYSSVALIEIIELLKYLRGSNFL